jgi:hypothetical protein
MQIYRSTDALKRLACAKDALGLQALVMERLEPETWNSSEDLASLLHILVMDREDTPQDLEHHLGFSILTNRWNGLESDHPDFTPSWDIVEVHEHWYVLTFIISDDGFGIVVFVPRGIPHALAALCDRYASEGHTG